MTRADRALEMARNEFEQLHPRWRAVRTLAAILPEGTGYRTRRIVYRWGGINIGRGTLIAGQVSTMGFGEPSNNLVIGRNCGINQRVVFDLGAMIILEDSVNIGPECLFLTVTHDIGDSTNRCGTPHALPIRIGTGSWLGARVTVLPGVTIGAGSVIGTGAVVARDIPPHSLAAGVPARVRDTLDPTPRTSTTEDDHSYHGNG